MQWSVILPKYLRVKMRNDYVHETKPFQVRAGFLYFLSLYKYLYGDTGKYTKWVF